MEGTEYFYYSMLKDMACLLSNKIMFTESARTQEIRKRRLVYDMKSVLARKEEFRRMSVRMQAEGSPDLKLDRIAEI